MDQVEFDRKGKMKFRMIWPLLSAFISIIVIVISYSTTAANSSSERDSRRSVRQETTSVTTTEGRCTYFIGFNKNKLPFDDVIVRKALAAAIDRSFIPTILDEYARPGLTFTAYGLFGHVDGYSEGVGIPFQPLQAKQWLGQAGYPSGQGFPESNLHYPYFSDFTDFNSLNLVLDAIQRDWHEHLGITVEIYVEEYNAFLAGVKAGEFQSFFYRWCTSQTEPLDAGYFLDDGIDYYRPGLGGWWDDSYQELVSKAASEPDKNQRRAFYKQAEEILTGSDVVIVPLFYTGLGVEPTIYLPVVIENS